MPRDRHHADRSTAADRPSEGSFRRFLLVGGTCTALQYLLLALLVDQARWVPVLASGASYAVAVLLNYELTRRFTFHGRVASWREFGRFVAVQLVGLALNVAIFEAVLRLGAPHYLLAQAAATAVVTVSNWTAYRLWAFRH
ncbi:MAG: GtrA family protein [Burkholderiaceae bacterium]|jgi:putative flippase GtrA|nr:GtrA family protein [Burkholderiales bacterium]MCZ8097062.1 GtrA family protein [Burkholderiales bacterium]MCZ8338107.1 GtrA family protein [Burkholderiaceae bacterium]